MCSLSLSHTHTHTHTLSAIIKTAPLLWICELTGIQAKTSSEQPYDFGVLVWPAILTQSALLTPHSAVLTQLATLTSESLQYWHSLHWHCRSDSSDTASNTNVWQPAIQALSALTLPFWHSLLHWRLTVCNTDTVCTVNTWHCSSDASHSRHHAHILQLAIKLVLRIGGGKCSFLFYFLPSTRLPFLFCPKSLSWAISKGEPRNPDNSPFVVVFKLEILVTPSTQHTIKSLRNMGVITLIHLALIGWDTEQSSTTYSYNNKKSGLAFPARHFR